MATTKTKMKKDKKRKISAEAEGIQFPQKKKSKSGDKLSKDAKKLRKAFKVAKKAYKADKSNKELKKAFKAAKAAWFEEKEKTSAPEKKEEEEQVEEETSTKVEETTTENGTSETAAVPASNDDGPTTIFCGNLPWSIDEDMIKEVFKACGEIVSVRWGTDRETGDFKGYGHIEFESSAACAKALAMNGTDCGGREMRIDAAKALQKKSKGGYNNGAEFTGPGAVPANPEQTPRCFVGNLSYKIDEDGLKNAFKEKGLTVVDVFFLTDKETGDFYGSSFCEFSSPDEAAKAVSFAGLPILGRPIKVDFAKPRSGGNSGSNNSGGSKREARPPSERPEGGTDTVFFGNLSFDIDDDSLKKWCKEQGAEDVTAIRWLTHKDTGNFKGCGFVQFGSVDSSDKVVKQSGTNIMGRSARIDYANS
eukprot:g627.t1